MLSYRAYSATPAPRPHSMLAPCPTCARDPLACRFHNAARIARDARRIVAETVAASVLACEDAGLAQIIPARVIARAAHVIGGTH